VKDAGELDVWDGASLVGTPAPRASFTGSAVDDRVGVPIRPIDLTGDGILDLFVGAYLKQI